MTQRQQFEAWAKSQSLDVGHLEADAWGRYRYTPHIHSMWQGWQAAQAQAADAQAKTQALLDGALNLIEISHKRQARDERIAQAAAEPVEAPGDIRALKHRIHELEGEVIGYKRILAEQAAVEPVGWVVDGGKHNGRLLYVHEYELDLGVQKIMCKPLYASPQPTTLALLDEIERLKAACDKFSEAELLMKEATK